MSKPLQISQISVLSEADRKALDTARRWLRYIYQEGFTVHFDALERDGIYDCFKALDSMALGQSKEPQFIRPSTLDESQIEDIMMDAKREEVAWGEAHPKPQFERRG